MYKSIPFDTRGTRSHACILSSTYYAKQYILSRLVRTKIHPTMGGRQKKDQSIDTVRSRTKLGRMYFRLKSSVRGIALVVQP